MVRAVAPGRDGASYIDAAVVAVAMFGCLWVLFVDDRLLPRREHDRSPVGPARLPGDGRRLLAVAARLVVTVHLKHPPFAFIVAAIGSLAVADTGYGIYNANGEFHTGLFIDAFWLGFYVLFGVAALHPAASTTARRRRSPRTS